MDAATVSAGSRCQRACPIPHHRRRVNLLRRQPLLLRCDLVERLTANTALVIGGTVAATLTASDSEISGLLFGAFFVADKAAHPLTQFPIQCTGVHDFVLRRR